MRSLNSREDLRVIGLAVVAAVLLPVVAAGSSEFPTNYSFETDAPGTEYVDINGDGPDGWSGDASAATSAMAVVEGEIYTNQYTGPLPLPGETHTNVLAFEGAISNIFRTYPDKSLYTNVTIDVMMKPGYYTSEPQLDSNPQVAAYVNTAGHVVVKHAFYSKDYEYNVGTAWTELSHDPIGSNDWARITLVLDYLSVSQVNPSFEEYDHFFSISVNGGPPITNEMAYTSPTWTDPVADRGGSWFMTADASSVNPDGGPHNKWFTSVEFQGVGSIDDLVVDAAGERPGEGPTPYEEWADGFGLTEGPDGDDDEDGASNWEEYLAGTIPNDQASVFKVIAQMLLDGTNWITFMDGTSSPVRTDFLMYRSTNLLGGWELVDGAIPRSVDGSNEWPDDSSPAGAAFYQPRLPDSE